MAEHSNIKLILTDMDGTLLNSRKEVSGCTLSVLRALREKGILFSICTGRIHTMTQVYAELLGLETPMVASNGAMVYDSRTGQVLWAETIAEEDVTAVSAYCEENGLDYCALALETNYFAGCGALRKRFLDYNEIAAEKGLPPMKTEDIDPERQCLRGLHVCKMLVMEKSPEKLSALREFLDRRQSLCYVSSDPVLFDIMRRGVDKGNGAVQLARILGLDPKEVCVFGDYYNDASMFREAGLSVAMGNAVPEMKAAADYVTKTNDEDGVAYAITELLKLL